jgi:integrase
MSLERATVKVVLKTGKVWKKANDTYPVKLRITYLRMQKFYTVKGESYTPEQFKAIINPNSKGANAQKRNAFEKIEERAKKVIEKLPEFSFIAFENEYLATKPQKAKTIHDYFEDKAEQSKQQTATLYRATIRSLKEFDKNISFDKITPAYLKRYENWFVEAGKIPQKKDAPATGGTYTTVGIYMRNMRAILNTAIKDGLPIQYPFGRKEDGKYPIPDSKNTKKALTIGDIEKLFQYETTDKNEFVALKYWLFSYLCNGMNMADIANLSFTDIKGGNIEFLRQKTKDTTKNKTKIKVLLFPEVQQIIDEIGNKPQLSNYIFPIYESGQGEQERFNRLKQHIKTTNKYMRRIASKIGINEQITTYWARHSYSTILKRSGAPIEFISEQLGHSDTKVTQNYLDGFEDEQRAKYSANLIPGKNE